MIASSARESLNELDYHTGLSRLQEAVISSHFMEAIARDWNLDLYGPESLLRRSLTIDDTAIDGLLVPTLVGAARRFGHERGMAAVERARLHHPLYGLKSAHAVGEAEVIAEVMFDRQFSRKAAATCSRILVRDRIASQLERERMVRMAIPALPFKIKSPLKSRGDLPDLAEVSFLLSLFEIALAVETAAEQVAPDGGSLAAKFIVVSDGARFASLANVSTATIARYHDALEAWIARLGLGRHILVEDYRELLLARLPQDLFAEKHRIARTARQLYTDVLGPAFDPDAMERSLALSRALEPDPEQANATGRFGSLLRSLVYTIDYRTLEALALPPTAKRHLYRELTARLFEPFEDDGGRSGFIAGREGLRREMLAEVWQATVEYMAEIKSDRDLDQDPVLVCLPGAVRWTIHAKAGQFAIATPSVSGRIVQPWAGAAVFRPAEKGAIRLCSYPVLGLEGAGAVPVFTSSSRDDPEPQPLFYIDREIAVEGIEGFIADLGRRLTRRRLK